MTTIATDVPTHEELVSRAQALVPVLRARAESVEEGGRIPDETIADLAEAGFLRFNSPREYGGYAVGGRTRNEVLAILASGDASTAWVVGVYTGGVANAGHLDKRMQEELFAAGPDVKICGSGTPTKDAEKVAGGYRISGRWFSVSGSAHADWVSVFFALPGEGGDGPGPMGKALVPRSDVTIDRTWDAAGMRGTESDTVVAEDVFVPDYRVELLAGPPPANPILSVGPCAIPIGIAQGALDRAVEYGGRKAVNGTIYQPAATATSYQNDLAEAALRIDTARLHLLRATSELDRAEEAGEELPLLERARMRGEAGWMMKNITDAIEIIMTAVGSGAFSSSSPFERAWRDVSTLARHGATSWFVGREVYGKVLLGQDGNISRLPV